CRVCHLELPFVQRLHEEWGDTDEVQIVGLSIDRIGTDAVWTHAQEQGFTFPQALATSDLRRALGAARAVPTTVIVDSDGRVHHVLVGVSGPGTLSRAVRRLVDREPGADD
ncbi:MAG: TlpA family protein disulfide reductase, partial [Gemmatimonadales bacterium]